MSGDMRVDSGVMLSRFRHLDDKSERRPPANIYAIGGTFCAHR